MKTQIKRPMEMITKSHGHLNPYISQLWQNLTFYGF